MTTGGPRRDAITKTWRGARARADHHSRSADEGNGNETRLSPDFYAPVGLNWNTHSSRETLKTAAPSGTAGRRHGQPNSRQARPRTQGMRYPRQGRHRKSLSSPRTQEGGSATWLPDAQRGSNPLLRPRQVPVDSPSGRGNWRLQGEPSASHELSATSGLRGNTHGEPREAECEFTVGE